MDRFKIKSYFDHLLVWNILESSIVNIREAGGDKSDPEISMVSMADAFW